MYERALEASERVLGPEHPDTLGKVNNLAGLLFRKGDYAGAQPLFEHALKGLLKVTAAIRRPHPSLQACIGNYSGCLKEMGRSDADIRDTLNALMRPFGMGVGGGDRLNALVRAWLPITPLLAVLLLLGLGLLMLHSIIGNPAWHQHWVEDATKSLFWWQVASALAGLGLMVLLARMDVRMLRLLAVPFSLVTLVLLALLLIPGIGYTIRGSSRLLPLGPFFIQPAALARLALPLFLAWWFDRISPDGRRPYVPILAIGVAMFLIGYEPDIPAALVIVLSGLVILVHARVSPLLLVLISTFGFSAASVGIISDAENMRRMLAYFGHYDEVPRVWPWQEALANAGWWGTGLGHSQMVKYYYDDGPRSLMTAVIGEELGWFGLSVILLTYVTLLAVGVVIARRAGDRFSYLLGMGIVWVMFFQLLLNAAGMMGLSLWHAPGLPFISFSVSGLMVDLASVGVLLSLARYASVDNQKPVSGC